MQVLATLISLPAFRNAVSLLHIDGVHMGHRQVIDKLKTEAKAIMVKRVISLFIHIP